MVLLCYDVISVLLGFDSTGRKFNGTGFFVNWWTSEADQEFTNRSQCLVDQFNAFTLQGQHVDGMRTLGENIADLGMSMAAEQIAASNDAYAGGLNVAYATYQAVAKQHTEQLLSEMSNDKLFWVFAAQGWCQSSTPEQDLAMLHDEHSPNPFRVLVQYVYNTNC